MPFPEAFLDDLRARTGLTQLVGRAVKLARAGREWKGCCPFHGEKTPSFFVNEEKGFYHCFGCGAHGDAIRFLMEHDHLGFVDAVKALAAEAGLAVPEDRPLSDAAERARQKEKQHRATLEAILEEGALWFEAGLQGSGGAAALSYLQRRRIPDAIRREFGLGYAPDRGAALLSHLKARNGAWTDALITEAGLAATREGRVFDRFRGRLMFPIHSPRGRLVGFGGRILGDGEPKYLNSADGPLFHKGTLLYNFHRAARRAREAGRLLVVEGYIDVLSLAAAGVGEAVAPLGTAITSEQLALLWKVVDEPILAFDGDGAGQRAAARTARKALAELRPGKSLAFVLLPAGQDPDDLAKSGGKQAIERLLQQQWPLVRFLYDATRADMLPGGGTHGAPGTPERRAAFRQRLRELAQEIADPELRRDYLQTWLDRFDRETRPARRATAAAPFPRGKAAGGRTGRKGGAGAIDPHPLSATRAQAQAPMEIHLGMLFGYLATNAGLVERHREELALLPLSAPMLERMRRILLDGGDWNAVRNPYPRLSTAGLSAEEVEREVATTLAQCLSTHQMAAAKQHKNESVAGGPIEALFERNRAAAQKVLVERDLLGDPSPEGKPR